LKKLDVLAQTLRINQAIKFIQGSSLLDIGCHNGEIFNFLLKKNKMICHGIDSIHKNKIENERFTIYPGYFPENFNLDIQYDSITMLAVVEHFSEDKVKSLPLELKKYLNQKGRVIITIPSKFADPILDVLLFFKLNHGMDLENHQDFDRSILKKSFTENGFQCLVEKKFEFGLNTLYVFQME